MKEKVNKMLRENQCGFRRDEAVLISCSQYAW